MAQLILYLFETFGSATNVSDPNPTPNTGMSALTAIAIICSVGLIVVALIVIFGHGDNSATLALLISTGASIVAALLGVAQIKRNNPPTGGNGSS